TSLRDELLADATLAIDPARLDAMLDPAQYLGSAEAFVDRALEAYEGGGL
ncbi:MAG: 3-carboxy-cis,cis-muconate cycloisomerase, partial [Actinobacteria bacterium]|nr:3-carboxy-cis,cis-muconate cycloisomerase [Actinomycetota bacterium]